MEAEVEAVGDAVRRLVLGAARPQLTRRCWLLVQLAAELAAAAAGLLQPRARRRSSPLVAELAARRQSSSLLAPLPGCEAREYRGEKVANRDTEVWHGATEIGP
jgi:hypothetical protein